MCWGCQVVPIHIAVDDIDSPFIWNSARHSAIDFSIVGKIWNVPFYIITSQLLTCCCSHGMQVFPPPQYTHMQTSTQACVLAHRLELTHTRLLVMTQHEPSDNSFPIPSPRPDGSQMDTCPYQCSHTVSALPFLPQLILVKEMRNEK